MKHLLAIAFITLLALGTGCAWISPSSQTANDGIKVHGHWTVTVTNPDGTVDAVHEFSNELFYDSSVDDSEYSSADMLTALLAGELAVNGWNIFVGYDSSLGEPFGCQESNTYPPAYVIATFARDMTFGTPLRLTATCTVDIAHILLSSPGDTTATANLKRVGTTIGVPSPGISTFGVDNRNITGQYTKYGNLPFTKHDFAINDRPNLQHNQAVTFNVVISFN